MRGNKIFFLAWFSGYMLGGRRDQVRMYHFSSNGAYYSQSCIRKNGLQKNSGLAGQNLRNSD